MIEIYIFLPVSFLMCELQPIGAELNIEPHYEKANQNRAQHYYSWPF